MSLQPETTLHHYIQDLNSYIPILKAVINSSQSEATMYWYDSIRVNLCLLVGCTVKQVTPHTNMCRIDKIIFIYNNGVKYLVKTTVHIHSVIEYGWEIHREF